MNYPPPNPPYVGPSRNHGAAVNKPLERIVIHETQSPCVAGAARDVARYFRTTTRDASAHYVVDPREVVQVDYDSVVAYHAPPNAHSIGVELCGYTSTDRARWRTPERRAMRKLAQRLVAELCLAYGIPPYYRSAAKLRAGKHGVTTHAQVSLAWGQTSHWDPGTWPRLVFMHGVRREIRAIRKGQR